MITEQDISELLDYGEISQEAARALRMRLYMNRRDEVHLERSKSILEGDLRARHEMVRTSGVDEDVPCLAASGGPCVCRNCRGWRGYSEEGAQT